MSEITTGLRAVLSHPRVYMAFQAMMGAERGRRMFVSQFVRPKDGEKILDVGCGTADIVHLLPDVSYWGFDISAPYIESAQQRLGTRGHFIQRPLDEEAVSQLPEFDTVLAVGLLHHLNDNAAQKTVRLAHATLRLGGRLVTIDPCLDPSQTSIARFLVRHDRGQNVRDLEGYRAVVAPIFDTVHGVVRHQRWIPYSHCIMECTK